MKKILLIMLSLLLFVSLVGCATSVPDDEMDTITSLTVAVGIVPQATFVEKVGGNLVNIVTLIPPGNSPANYRPTASEMQALSDAAVYFTMQMPTEEANILPKVNDFNQDIKIVNLRSVVSEAYPLLTIKGPHHHDEHDDKHDEDHEEHSDNQNDHDENHEEQQQEVTDPHLWLSPKRAIVMVQTIADELSAMDTNNKQIYQDNAKSYIEEIKALDNDIQEKLDDVSDRTFMIYHGAYGYFADDYGFDMIALERAGKPATAAQMQEVIQSAKQEGITMVFYQVEFDDSQVRTLAEEIGGNVAKSEPLTPDYIQGLKNFTNALVEQGE